MKEIKLRYLKFVRFYPYEHAHTSTQSILIKDDDNHVFYDALDKELRKYEVAAVNIKDSQVIDDLLYLYDNCLKMDNKVTLITENKLAITWWDNRVYIGQADDIIKLRPHTESYDMKLKEGKEASV